MSRISDPSQFARKVKGVLKARFVLDGQGAPAFEVDDEDKNLKHYEIGLSLECKHPWDLDGVTYFLDKEAYEHPVFASVARDNQFTVGISSYGDFELRVEVQIGAEVYEQRARLSALLEVGHRGEDAPAIRAAIEDIKSH